MNCYRCHTTMSHRDDTCRSCGQEMFTQFAKGEVSYGRRVDGCLQDEPRPSDYRATPNLDSLPARVDLREYCTPVEDQGQIGSCVANAIVGAFELQRKRERQPHTDFSRLFVYYNARKIQGDPTWDTGSTISSGMAAMLAFGAPSEASWPYRFDTFAMPPPPDVYREAAENVPAEYARVFGLDNIRGAIARGFPVVVAANIPFRVYQEAGDTGVAPKPSRDEVDVMRSRHGRHALLLVGYDKHDGTILARNSWGEGWGDKGYFRMSVDTYEEVAASNTTWILGRLDAGDFTMERPMKPAAAPTPPRVEGGVKDMAEKMRNEIRDGLKKDIADSFKDIKERLKPRQGQ